MYAVIGHELRTPASILKMQMENAARHQNSINKALFNNTLDQLIDVVEKSTASRAHLTLEVSAAGGARTRPNGRTIRGPKCSPSRLECSAGRGRQRDP